MHYLALLPSQRQVLSYLCMDKSILMYFVCCPENPTHFRNLCLKFPKYYPRIFLSSKQLGINTSLEEQDEE